MQLWPAADGLQTREERAKLKADRFYKVVLHTKDYFASSDRKCFYPWVDVGIPYFKFPRRHCSRRFSASPRRLRSKCRIPMNIIIFHY